MTTVAFGDLARQAAALGDELNAALLRTAMGGWYVLGREVRDFETEYAAYCGAQASVGVASGAEALYLALRALDVGPGVEVITVANACMYQAAAILQTGARPRFVDIDPHTHNLDPALLEAAITPQTRAIMPVHLYGRLADMPAIAAIAAAHNLPIIEDAAQAHGAWRMVGEQVRRAGAWGDLAAFSFYPSKNLGALGDAGALTAATTDLAERLRRLRFYGWGEKYVTIEDGGRNSRLDEIQAAALRVKLRHLDDWNARRRAHAATYRELLADLPIRIPPDEPGHVYHLFVIECEQRDELRAFLQTGGIGCDVHYPLPAHLQPAYAELGGKPGDLPHTERAAQQLLSLPLYPELRADEIEAVAARVRAFFA